MRFNFGLKKIKFLLQSTTHLNNFDILLKRTITCEWKSARRKIPVKIKRTVTISVLLVSLTIAAIFFSVFFLIESNNLLSANSSQANKITQLESELDQANSANSQLRSQIQDLQQQIVEIQQTKAAKGGKTAYLTFDDGPSGITADLLNILQQNSVHATFFVVGKNAVNYPDVIKLAYSQGNAIGVHSWTHDYKYIYSSEENFFEDFNKLKDYLTDLLGATPTVCRYPGGSNNKVSLDYSDHILRKLDPKVKAMGFKPYDWNSYAGDAESGPKPSKDTIVSNVMKDANYKTLVILFHDTDANGNDLLALPEIISDLRNKGYSFGILSQYSPNCQAPIR